MTKQKTISRNLFLRLATGLVFGLVTWLWYMISRFQAEQDRRTEFRHGVDIPLGISYFGSYYLFRSGQSVRAFLTRCTHAGCRIGVGSGSTLQCNCHGSQFAAENGKPLRGPAIKPLQEVECRFDSKAEQWIVTLDPTGIRT